MHVYVCVCNQSLNLFLFFFSIFLQNPPSTTESTVNYRVSKKSQSSMGIYSKQFNKKTYVSTFILKLSYSAFLLLKFDRYICKKFYLTVK